MKIWLPIAPNTKPRMTSGDRYNSRPCVEQYRSYCDRIRLLWLDTVGQVEPPNPCKLIFFIPMPPSWSKKKQEQMLGTPHQQAPDFDNLTKAFFDALYPRNEGFRIFSDRKDDSHIYGAKPEKYWSSHGGILVEAITPEDPSYIRSIIEQTKIYYETEQSNNRIIKNSKSRR
jgi:Holliday junction resolvase RusA-like endonuclease